MKLLGWTSMLAVLMAGTAIAQQNMSARCSFIKTPSAGE